MELRVAVAAKQPGEIFECDMEETLEPQEYAGRWLTFDRPLQMKFHYSYDGKAFTLEGDMSFALKSRCALCDEPFTDTLHIPFEERFVKGGKGETDEDAYTCEGDTLRLDTMVLDNLYLHLPLKSICGQGCRGLCPVCGCNMNMEQCACGGQFSGNPLSRLSALMNESKEV